MVPNTRALLFFIAVCLPAQTNFLSGLPVADAHNCYPYQGRWSNRLDRALSFGFPVAIEQDLAWYVDHIVVSHTPQPTGAEPTLRQHFFERVRPIVEKALRENKRDTWPIIVVHFDFKDNQPALLHAVWELLGEYQSWITTASKGADPRVLAAFDPKPLLVLTEDSDAQEAVFFNEVPVGARLRVFGSAHTAPVKDDHLLATIPPERLLTAPPTNYRRWWNNSWYVVEEGGASRAGDWTPYRSRSPASACRLRPQARLLDSLLHVGRLYGCRRSGLGRQLQLRVSQRCSSPLAGGARRSSELDRYGSI